MNNIKFNDEVGLEQFLHGGIRIWGGLYLESRGPKNMPRHLATSRTKRHEMDREWWGST